MNKFTQAERIQIGLDYVNNTDFSLVENGKHELVKNEVYAIVQDYYSKPLCDGKYEAHKTYIDIQYIIKGEEQIGIGKLADFNEETKYNEEKDIVFLSPKKNAKTEFLKLREKEYAIFKPEDVHMPSIAINKTDYVRKVVVKVLF